MKVLGLLSDDTDIVVTLRPERVWRLENALLLVAAIDPAKLICP